MLLLAPFLLAPSVDELAANIFSAMLAFWYNRRLLKGPSVSTRIQWLALVLGMSGPIFVVAGLTAIVFLPFDQASLAVTPGRFPLLPYHFVAIALMQAVLLGSAIRIYCAIGRESGDFRQLSKGFLSGAIYSLFVFLLPVALIILDTRVR